MAKVSHKRQYAIPPDGSVLVFTVPNTDDWNFDSMYNKNTTRWELSYDHICKDINEAIEYIKERMEEDGYEESDFRIYALNVSDRLVIEEYEEMVPVKKFRVVDKSQPAGLI